MQRDFEGSEILRCSEISRKYGIVHMSGGHSQGGGGSQLQRGEG